MMLRRLSRMYLVRATAVLIIYSIGPGEVWAGKQLDIAPVMQKKRNWCWAAAGEMVFRYYGVGNINPVGNFQCGIVALLHTTCDQDCSICDVGVGSVWTMNNMLTTYPTVASEHTGTETRISTHVSLTHLKFQDLRAEIKAGRPVLAGISPSGYRKSDISEHVVVIVGYDGDALIVNDPFPYQFATFVGNPYQKAEGTRIKKGQYRIAFANFVNRLKWRETIYGVTGKKSNSGRKKKGSYGHSCKTPVGRCGPFPHQSARPVGSSCHCIIGGRRWTGVVVQP